VHFDDHPNDVAMRDHAYKQGAAVYEAVGATVTYPTPPYPSTHNLGTNRMSEKPGDGVVNKFGQTHDVKNLFISDGSQFTSGAACNPTLTIVDPAGGPHRRRDAAQGNLVPTNGSGSVQDRAAFTFRSDGNYSAASRMAGVLPRNSGTATALLAR
jgi:hypothetical protein